MPNYILEPIKQSDGYFTNSFQKLIFNLVYFMALSKKYVILFSIERYIVVQFPLKKYDICNQSRNKLSVAFFFIFSLLFYSFSYFSSHVHEYENQKRCVIKEKWHKIVQLMAIIDVFVTILIPFVVILFTNISIYFKLMKNLNLENGFERKRKNEEFSTDASFLGAKINDKIEANEFVAKNSILLSGRRKTVSIIRENYLNPQIELKRQISYPELSSFNEKNELKIPTQKKTNFTFFRKFSALTSLLRRSAELKRAKIPMAISRIHSVLLSSIESHSNHSLTTNSSNHSSNNTSTGYTIKELNHHLMQRISGYFYYLNFSRLKIKLIIKRHCGLIEFEFSNISQIITKKLALNSN
ncbi:thyrotropin-releasing hormone receptor-like [Brachionus plicatilis]|uniref:Thyrotropin-releasing hormone receptor-like n=1 Tax=Brachionus plicatilis TaxID=10195 RepID=A0A3M7SZS8_BRAPC|nr:thyrotropin-releasing hormone receptor-like [Brachionus plicatilis]